MIDSSIDKISLRAFVYITNNLAIVWLVTFFRCCKTQKTRIAREEFWFIDGYSYPICANCHLWIAEDVNLCSIYNLQTVVDRFNIFIWLNKLKYIKLNLEKMLYIHWSYRYTYEENDIYWKSTPTSMNKKVQYHYYLS